MDQYYKKYGFYIEDDPAWAVRERGVDTHGKGDLISNTCRKIFDEGDTSPWAYEALVLCADLLAARKRWPDFMNQSCDAKTWLGAHISHLLYDLGLVKLRKFRNQKGMTRDPYTNFYGMCMLLDRKQFIEAITIPWRLYSPEVFTWRKRLLRPHKEKYVNDQRYLRAKAITLNAER